MERESSNGQMGANTMANLWMILSLVMESTNGLMGNSTKECGRTDTSMGRGNLQIQKARSEEAHGRTGRKKKNLLFMNFRIKLQIEDLNLLC